MEAYAKVLLIAIPFFLLLIAVEATYAYFKGNFNFRSFDTISSLSSGSTNTLKSVLGLTLIIVGYEWFFNHFAIVEIKATWLVYVLSFIAIDFASYCHHYLAHKVNIFWNRHVIHHSGEDFNLPTALRQSISSFVNIGVFFLLPAAILGLPPKVITVIAPIHLFLQFWYHTEHIGKLGWLEYIIVTPSQHRVHHAINPIYLDKNLSAIFCIWDRLFGTFQEELEEEPCVYGVTRQVETWNPIRINFQHLWLLTKDAWRTKNWWDKCRIWFMPTGWRPADMLEKYPVVSADPSNFIKYDTAPSKALQVWSWVQYAFLTLFSFQFLLQFTTIGSPEVFIYGGFMFLMVYSYSALMDKDKNALWLELLKLVIGLGIIWYTGGWFFIDNLLYGGAILVAIYLFISVGVVAYFVFWEIVPQKQLAPILTLKNNGFND